MSSRAFSCRARRRLAAFALTLIAAAPSALAQVPGLTGTLVVTNKSPSTATIVDVANAYLLLRPGNAIVYHNAKEFGDDRDFPKDGRGDALGGLHGNAVTTLVNLRNTHGRGNYLPRVLEKESLVYEREKSALVVLSNRLDGGFDSRTVQTSFAPGTPLR